MGSGNSGMQGQRADEQGVLHPAWAAVVTQQYGGQLNEESLFLFCGRRTDRIKALYWTGDGYILLYNTNS